jgi:hypothetical protein
MSLQGVGSADSKVQRETGKAGKKRKLMKNLIGKLRLTF